jgi:hypothetical protein
MANYCAKGEEYMRELARRGGVASGKARRFRKFEDFLLVCAIEPGEDLSMLLLYNALRRAGLLKGPKLSGGSHETDWRCPECHHFNSEKRRACATCNNVAPLNGRLNRKRLREMEKEHRYAALLKEL